jgi:hypothetical protein
MQYRTLTQATRFVLLVLTTLTVTGTTGAATEAVAFRDSSAPTEGIVGGSSPHPLLKISQATVAERELVEWAFQRFEIAGLPLPPVTVTFHETNEGCRGYQGYYSRMAGTLDICNRGGGKTDQRHTLLHELAHAWSFSALTDSEMEAFVAHRGLDHWRSPDVAWWQMGQEQAAEIIAWGLQDEDEFKSIWVFTEECDGLARDFEMLTGIVPLHGNTAFCAAN